MVGNDGPRLDPLEEKIAATCRFAAQVIPWLERGLVRPIVDSVFGFEEAARCARRVESGFWEGCFMRRPNKLSLNPPRAQTRPSSRDEHRDVSALDSPVFTHLTARERFHPTFHPFCS